MLGDILNRPVKALQRPHGAAQPQRHAVAQDLVQLGPGQGQARADVPPQLVQVDVDEQAPTVVEQALAGRPPGGSVGRGEDASDVLLGEELGW
jgi:hypothetical protein